MQCLFICGRGVRIKTGFISVTFAFRRHRLHCGEGRFPIQCGTIQRKRKTQNSHNDDSPRWFAACIGGHVSWYFLQWGLRTIVSMTSCHTQWAYGGLFGWMAGYNTIQFYCLCVEKFAFWLIIYIKTFNKINNKTSTTQWNTELKTAMLHVEVGFNSGTMHIRCIIYMTC